jgi:hypothetical protein
MPIDTSMYANSQPIPVSVPSPMAAVQQGMAMGKMALENQQLQRQAQTVMATKQAYQDNTAADGTLDQLGMTKQLGQTDPMAAQAASASFADTNKKQAEATDAKIKAAQDGLTLAVPFVKWMQGMSEEDREKVYGPGLQNLKNQGVDTSQWPDEYDPQHFAQASQMTLAAIPAATQYLANQGVAATTAQTIAKTGAIPSEIAKNQAEAGKANAETAQVGMAKGAEELGKFNEDVNNASSRKTTGALINARDRADRITALLNQGAPPNETDPQKVARLNKAIPQIGQEVTSSLANIMQGGSPDDASMKKLDPNTVQSELASLQQRWTASPTAANQGAILNEYGKIASNLRDFSQGRLQDITDRARAAYPNAEKYYPDRLDKISAPILAPGASYGVGKGDAGSAPSAAPAPAGNSQYRASGSSVSGDQVNQYATKHNMKLSDAQSFLRSQGYAVGN